MPRVEGSNPRRSFELEEEEEEEDRQAFVSGKRTYSKKQDQLKSTSLNVTQAAVHKERWRDGEKIYKYIDRVPCFH